jgi:hypothetical protein
MALQFTKTLQVKRDGGTVVLGIASLPKATGAECDADLALQVQTRVQQAQGNLDELAEIQSKL